MNLFVIICYTKIIKFMQNVNTSVGREKRKELINNLKFVLGAELLADYTFNQTKDLNQGVNKTNSFGVGIEVDIGFRYEINNLFYANAELLPSLKYNNSRSGSTISKKLWL
tara:strand:+ start:238 stop:570 length:333 start_codon:yes stop_codon:yes gene_type:complete